MKKEVQDVHELQAKVGERHRKAFEQLSAQLEEAKKTLAAYSTSQLQTLQGRASSVDKETREEKAKVLDTLRRRVTDLTQQLEQLQRDSTAQIAAQKLLTQTLETELTKSDQDILGQLSELNMQADNVERQQAMHASQLKAALEAQGRTEQLDKQDALQQQDSSLGLVAGSVQGNVESARNFVQQAIQQGLASLNQGINQETAAEGQMWAKLTSQIAQQNATVTSDDQSRLEKLQALKLDFEKLSEELKQEMNSISDRLQSAQYESSSDKTELSSKAESSNSFLLGRMDAALAGLDNATETISAQQKQRVDQLELAESDVAHGVKAFGDLHDSAQLQWEAQKYNFDSEVRRKTAEEQDKLGAMIGTQLHSMEQTVDTEMRNSDQQLHALEAYSESKSLATNASLSAVLESLKYNATERWEQVAHVLHEYQDLNSSRQNALLVGELDNQKLIQEIEHVQQALSEASTKGANMLKARSDALIQDVAFNASQTLEQDEVRLAWESA
jgi:hypothetical protein